jgi:hypothetical protein
VKSSSHWYTREGLACYEVPYKDPAKGMRKTTLADARKMSLLPSVTTITQVLAAPALVEWLRREAILAAVTTPRKDGEDLDSFVERCLSVDAEDTADKAKQLGTDIHDAIENLLSGTAYQRIDLDPFVIPAGKAVQEIGRVTATEKILVGDGYAGKTDCICENDLFINVIDFKTTKAKKLPKESYPEHKLQLAAYAACLGNTGNKHISTFNIYISTINPGQISVCQNPDWDKSYAMFKNVLELWQWQNDFKTTTP